MAEYPSGTVAFLFTDIEGSTRRWETHQTAMWQTVERHFALLRSAIATHQGILYKTVGDAVQAAFPTVPAAVAAASTAQAALRAEDWGELGPLRVRMAIHAGEAAPQDGDYLAPILNRLSRVLAAGHGDQILLTEAARTLATRLPPGHALKDLGQHRLRDLLEPEHVYQLTGPGLPLDVPPLTSLDLQPNNLPAQPTTLIGRETELSLLGEAITADGARLVTLTGPGGSGKTRLALQAAAESLETFPDGVWWVPLATVSDPELLPQTIAAALAVRESPGEDLFVALSEHLRSRRVLLLLDNVEHLLEAAPLLARLLDAAPRLVILATSREPLRLRAEREFPVDPLPLPAARGGLTLQSARASPAVQLFVARAQAVKPGFALAADNLDDVVAICRYLDGLPLAIELAAARVRILSPAALLARLDRRLVILTGGARDLPARQQTLRATIDWSHELLQPAEQTLFARLGVFAGGCTFDTAEAVCDAAGGIALELFDGLESLVQKSLLRQEADADGETRFTMLQTIREFALERLAELPDVGQVHQAHADAFLTIAEHVDWDDLAGQTRLLDRLEADHANLRQAIEYIVTQGQAGDMKRARFVIALAPFWWIRGHYSEGRHFLDGALSGQTPLPPLDRAAALTGAAMILEAQWELDRARSLHEEALDLYRAGGYPPGIAKSLTGLGVIARHQGDLDAARASHQEALDLWRGIGDTSGTAGALLDLGIISHLRGDREHARPLLAQSLQLFDSIHDVPGQASTHQWLGITSLAIGNAEDAADYFSRSLDGWRQLGNQQMIAADLGNLGETRHLSGVFDEAEAYYQEALACYAELDDAMGRGFILSQLGRLELDRGQTDAAVALLADGLQLRSDARDTSGVADTLDALAEALVKSGQLEAAGFAASAGEVLRAETGLARLPIYEERFASVKDAIGDVEADGSITAEALVQRVLLLATDATQVPRS